MFLIIENHTNGKALALRIFLLTFKLTFKRLNFLQFSLPFILFLITTMSTEAKITTPARVTNMKKLFCGKTVSSSTEKQTEQIRKVNQLIFLSIRGDVNKRRTTTKTNLKGYQ